MIRFHHVSDQPIVFGERKSVLSDACLHLEKGRYALCSRTPDSHRFVIDVMAGVRVPQLGRVTHQGLVSWPLGRQGFVRGKATGLRTAMLVCRLYGLSEEWSIDVLADLMTAPDLLDQSMEDWPMAARQEFTFSLGLLPDFDIYVVDGALPADTNRFGRLWRGLFEDRLVGRTLILSTYRSDQLLDYCSKALVLENGALRVEDDLETQLKRFPSRRVPSQHDSATDDMASDELMGEQLGL